MFLETYFYYDMQTFFNNFIYAITLHRRILQDGFVIPYCKTLHS